MSRLVAVDLSPADVSVVGELVAPGLVIVPVVVGGGLNGCWTLVHAVTGITLVDVRQPLPFTHLRFLATLLAGSGVDWCTPIPTARALQVARGAEQIVAALSTEALLEAWDRHDQEKEAA